MAFWKRVDADREAEEAFQYFEHLRGACMCMLLGFVGV
jgi:hypothetical protein